MAPKKKQTKPMRGVTAEDGTSFARFERSALELFVVQSIDSTTTKQIAAKAGQSEGLLYRYVSSKNVLAENMFFKQHESLASLVRDTSKSAGTINEKAQAIVDAYMQCADDDWTLFSYHILNSHRFLRQDRSIDNPVDAVEDILREAMEKKEIPSGSPVLISSMALGAVLQPAYHKAYGRLEGSLSDYADPIIRSVLAIVYQK